MLAACLAENAAKGAGLIEGLQIVPSDHTADVTQPLRSSEDVKMK